MSVTTQSRQASVDQIAAEMDRRGKVIEQLEARLSHIDGIYKGAIDNLNHHQRQLDMDGIEVAVSRQALTEVLIGLEAAFAAAGPVCCGSTMTIDSPTERRSLSTKEQEPQP